ncbi:MAG: hypothetical protein LLG01_09610 [Planctomycetaceae bacterium]|nr:hypothetical protein [Planctomycetaceae bacterium]
MHRRLDVLAKASGKSLNSVVIETLEREVQTAVPLKSQPAHRRRASHRPRR